MTTLSVDIPVIQTPRLILREPRAADFDAVAGRLGLVEHDGWPEPELGWHIYEGFEGRGYAYEGAMAARDHACRVMGMAPMISCIAPENLRSRRLAERMGAVIERETELLGQPCLIYRHPAGDA